MEWPPDGTLNCRLLTAAMPDSHDRHVQSTAVYARSVSCKRVGNDNDLCRGAERPPDARRNGGCVCAGRRATPGLTTSTKWFAKDLDRPRFTIHPGESPIAILPLPRHAGSFTLGVEHAAGWRLGATLSHFGGFFTDPSNTGVWTLAYEDGELLGAEDDFDLREPVVFGTVPSHTLLSAHASVRVPRTPLTVWLQGRNLANGLRPGAARTVTAGLRVEF